MTFDLYAQRKMKADPVVFVALVISWCMVGLCQRPSKTLASPKHALDALPEDLGILQRATGFQDWKSVQGYSRALTHYRQLRFDKDSNVFISQTGTKPGQVDVVEAILM